MEIASTGIWQASPPSWNSVLFIVGLILLFLGFVIVDEEPKSFGIAFILLGILSFIICVYFLIDVEKAPTLKVKLNDMPYEELQVNYEIVGQDGLIFEIKEK